MRSGGRGGAIEMCVCVCLCALWGKRGVWVYAFSFGHLVHGSGGLSSLPSCAEVWFAFHEVMDAGSHRSLGYP